jgi:hypothetical protein
MAMESSEQRALAYKACLAAAWSDQAMSVNERRILVGLIEQLAQDERERAVFRQLSLSEVGEEPVFTEIAKLAPDEKKWVFELCLRTLACDRKLKPSDHAFLGRLRRVCGVGLFAYQSRLWRLRQEGVRVTVRRNVAIGLGIAAVAFFMALPRSSARSTAAMSGREIRLRAPDQETPGAPPLAPELVYRSARDSFATVEILKDGERVKAGSAWAMGDDDAGDQYFLTNRHVVQLSYPQGSKVSYRLKFPPAESVEAVLDFMSEKSDIALLRLAHPGHLRPMLALRTRATLAVGEKVFALGSPNGLEQTFTAGIISALRDDYLQTDAAIGHGSSGGPLLDSEGRLCGIMTRTYENKNFSFAIYADAVSDALAERRGKAGKNETVTVR